MNNEEKILGILERMEVRLSALEQGQDELRKEQVKMREDQIQMREEMNEHFDTLEASLKFAWQDIALMERRIKQHEKEFHNAG